MGSLTVAYLLWLLTGVFGGHLLYVGRPKQAFIYMQTFGLFGVGWLRDACALPRYLRELNGVTPTTPGSRPRRSCSRVCTSLVLGTMYAVSVASLTSAITPPWWVWAGVVAAVSASASMVGSVGRQLVSVRDVVPGALVGLPLAVWSTVSRIEVGRTDVAVWPVVVGATGCMMYRRKHRPDAARPRAAGCNVFKFVGMVVISGLLATVTTVATVRHLKAVCSDGTVAPVGDCIAWCFEHLDEPCGFQWTTQPATSNPFMWWANGVPEHLTTLELQEGATLEEVKVAYRRLSRQYHPDKNPGDEAAMEQFLRIQAAHEYLVEHLPAAGHDHGRRRGHGADTGSGSARRHTHGDEL